LTNYIKKIKSFDRIDIINYLILLYAFVLTFPQGIKRFSAILLIILWISDKTKTTNLANISVIFITFNLFIIFTLLSYFWSDSTIQEVFQYAKRYWHYLPLFVIYKYIKKEYISLSITLFLSGVFISEVLSYGNFFSIWQIGVGSVMDPTVFYNHTQYSIFLAISSIFLLFKTIDEKNNLIKLFLFLFFLSVTLNLLLNGGRTGQIAFFITIIFVSFYRYKFNIKYIIISIISTALIFILALNLSSIFSKRMNLIKSDLIKISKGNYNTSTGARIGFYIIVKDIFIINPILGAGTTSHLQLSKKIISEKYQTFTLTKKLAHFHNQYLEVLSQLGLIGLSFFIFLIVMIYKIKIQEQNIKMIKVITILVFCIGSMADVLFYLHGTISLFSFIIGISLAQYRYEKNKGMIN
jgi:O-antigen ligase